MPRFHEEGMVQVNNLTRIYTESPMLQAVVSTVAIYGGLAEGVSGSELREWLLSGSEPVEDANGTAEAESAAADTRIAELVRQRDAAVEAYGELEREIAEKRMELPKDADGVPIRVGDKVFFRSDGPITVMSIGMSQVYGMNDFGFYGPAGQFFGRGTLGSVRHVAKRPIEDVLATFRFDAKNIYDDPTLNGNERVDELEALDADVAAEIRDLMEANNG